MCWYFFLEEFCCGPCCLAWTFLLDSLSVCEGWNLVMDQDHLPHWTYPKAGYLNPVSECKWLPRMPQVKAGTLWKQCLGLEPFTSFYFDIPHATSMYRTVLCISIFVCSCFRWHVTVCSRDVGIIGSGASAVAAFIDQSECRRDQEQTCTHHCAQVGHLCLFLWPALADGCGRIGTKPSPKYLKKIKGAQSTNLGSLRFSPFRGWFGNLGSTPPFPPYPIWVSLHEEHAFTHPSPQRAERRFWQGMASADIVNWKLCCKWWSLS